MQLVIDFFFNSNYPSLSVARAQAKTAASLGKQLSGSNESLASTIYSTASGLRPKVGIMSKIGGQTPHLTSIAAKKQSENKPILQVTKNCALVIPVYFFCLFFLSIYNLFININHLTLTTKSMPMGIIRRMQITF